MIRCLPIVLALSFATALAAPAAEPDSDRDRARDDKIADLEHKLAVVVDELETLRAQSAVPETEADLISRNGYGPAASKIYSVASGVSLGGYAEGVYTRAARDGSDDDADTWDLARAVLYVGYKFTDRLVWNSEIEFEHATTEQDGSVNVEFATLDYLWRPSMNFRVGEVLVPMGLVNQMHEPPFFYGTQRPGPERFVIPATWGENGAGLFGDLGEQLHYQFYVLAGLDATGFTPEEGVRDGRQGGSESLAEDIGWVGRMDFDLLPGLRVGASYFTGDAGQDQEVDIGGGTIVELPETRTTLWEAHGEWRWRGLLARMLWAEGHIGDAGQLSSILTSLNGDTTTIARDLEGGYAEVGYDLMQLFSPGSSASLEPFVRYEYIDLQDRVPSGFPVFEEARRRVVIPGLQWKPIPNVVLKVDYRSTRTLHGHGHEGDELGLGFGLVF